MYRLGFTPQQRYLSMPAILSELLLYSALVLYGISHQNITPNEYFILYLGIGGILFSIFLFYFVIPYPERSFRWRWGVTLINSLGLSLLTTIFTADIKFIMYVLIIQTAIFTAITMGRAPAYVFVLVTCLTYFSQARPPAIVFAWIVDLSPFLVSIILAETLLRLQEANLNQIKRLELINRFSRQINVSIEAEQVISLLHAAVQDAFEADTYYVAISKDDHLELGLIYDDGEYYQNIKIPVEGSLAGQVVKNRQSFLIQDLLKEQSKQGYEYTKFGKDKINLSWMGTPLQVGQQLIGVLAVGSYHQRAFNQSDMDLLQNLAQQASLALDNAYHHTEVEQQSHLDSLTQITNHGYFLNILSREAEESIANNRLMSLIMMDIDNFKLYNDTYGHLVGDQVLIALTHAIRANIHETDTVGRWGGEEFCILLTGANGRQAVKIARRIRTTLASLKVDNREGEKVPAPTASQGVAVYPRETDDIYELIDLADQRLYIAKEHGKAKIEPDEHYWDHQGKSKKADQT